MDIEFEPMIDRLNDSFGNPKKWTRKSADNGRNVFINAPPRGLEKEYEGLFKDGALEFLIDLVLQFENEVEELYNRRLRRKLELRSSGKIPKFSNSRRSLDENWKVAPVGERLQNRHLDLGDVSPSDISHFVAALRSPVQGIQVDFDDGHCPTWRNQIVGLHNISRAVQGHLPGVPKISEAPILMLRPRAWNMFEMNMSINGRLVPGPLFDFGFLIYHNGREIFEKTGTGPAFYLSKLECAEEAKLWNDIFVWSEIHLGFPRGTLKACVLIENILSAFEMDDILWELREHSLGLNCGIWDYAASIISKFGTSGEKFLIPDRKKYVNVRRKFLSSYMQLVVKICHKRGTHATGGMVANLLPSKDKNPHDFRAVLRTVCEAKFHEIKIGLDGFMVYDLGLVSFMNELWREHGGISSKNQIYSFAGNSNVAIMEDDLFTLPKGGVTTAGLDHNVRVGILFIFHWLIGKGHFAYKGYIEDSATAEISRSQVWQWTRYGANLEDENRRITRDLVRKRASKIVFELQKDYGTCINSNQKLFVALDLFLDLVNRRDFPEFITTYLNEEHIFRKFHSNLAVVDFNEMGRDTIDKNRKSDLLGSTMATFSCDSLIVSAAPLQSYDHGDTLVSMHMTTDIEEGS